MVLDRDPVTDPSQVGNIPTCSIKYIEFVDQMRIHEFFKRDPEP
jgi:hypothetical protein